MKRAAVDKAGPSTSGSRPGHKVNVHKKQKSLPRASEAAVASPVRRKQQKQHGLSRASSKAAVASPVRRKQQNVASSGDDIVSSQAQYIINLEQQVYFLENQISHLSSRMEESGQIQPSMAMEAEKMVKKLGEAQTEIQDLRVEVKRKNTDLDFLRSEKERLMRQASECQEIQISQKRACLNELIELRKARDDHNDKVVGLERNLEDHKRIENDMLKTIDVNRVQRKELRRSLACELETNNRLKRSVTSLRKSLSERELELAAKDWVADEDVNKLKVLKNEIQGLHERLNIAEQNVRQEQTLRTRLAEDNAAAIRRQADLKAELAEAKALVVEGDGQRASLEIIHWNYISEASHLKTEIARLKEDLREATANLEAETEHAHDLAMKLAEERRRKNKEEDRAFRVEKKLHQREERLKSRETENNDLRKENALMIDHINLLEKQIRTRDEEVDTLKHKVQEMEIAVEEFMQNSNAASQLEGQRWEQLTELAKRIGSEY